ncbi:phosphocholine-specific phospholipase C [Pseudofrankia sp. BMG5.36]|uniref:phosphocholine-specific phospholipase C n=1 Tax=Pseudofrankia sp. BMG5.36 TaxID=1834512 RepID=UPI0008DA246F|nr:phospholipase C, phosphocholine-specific [Pseudofrankia sp. BMG5.36]OHV73412.1 phospholipase C, phosphocholine-specific [Pseudofrankia sp. BMG5.36]
MVDIDRRRFLSLAGGAAALVTLDQSIARAAAIPANRRTGTIKDVEHIVVLMQENRSFDHYFGALRGVRGFGEPHPAVLPSGKPVWNQPGGTGELLPFHPDAADLGAAFLTGLPHAWSDGHQALNNGVYDQWVPAKGTATMAYLQRQDAAFHYALADAFTVCDAYYCSFVGNTDPNRYYMWTGWTGNDGKGGGPVLYNDELGYDWKTYPERLEAAHVSWKVYQDEGTGLDAAGSWGWTSDPYIGNYGDTSLLYFNTYRNAQPGSPLYEKARRGTKASAGQDYFELLRADVKANRLPSISYVTAPEAFSEHSNWPSNYGAWYIAKVLDALTSNPDVWSKTILLITYDENDGFFDHLVPPHVNSELIPGASTVPTTNEVYRGPLGNGHFGLGPRVPMYAVSPWSTGGWVASETFDHTSIIRLMERRFGVKEPNITPWRRAICGDLTSAFDFSKEKANPPKLPDTSSWAPRDHDRHPTYYPAVPATGAMPRQERGQRPARPTPYELSAEETSKAGAATIAVEFDNDGALGAHFQARLLAPAGAPYSYTVGAGDKLTAKWLVSGNYDIHVHGPNGFFRRYAGKAGADKASVSVRRSGKSSSLQVSIDAPKGVTVDVRSAYDKQGTHGTGSKKVTIDTRGSGGWYDITVSVPGTPWVRVFAGHLEDGKPSVSDPQLGG